MPDAVGQAVRRALLARLLGGYEPTPLTLMDRTREPSPEGMTIERLAFQTSGGERIRGFLTAPRDRSRLSPAVLYAHAHGNRYGMGANELVEGRPALLPEPYGMALAKRGVMALSIDMPCFGDRAREPETSLAKRLHWEGRTLFGRMLEDLGGAFRWLSALDGVDPHRISVFGFSMGATHAFWLGALESGIARVAHACSFADLGMLVAAGAHDLHGPYMTVPGLTRRLRTGEIAGLCAPRPQLALMGALDPLTPPDALAGAVTDLQHAYSDAPHVLRILVEPETGHRETEWMRLEVLRFVSEERTRGEAHRFTGFWGYRSRLPDP